MAEGLEICGVGLFLNKWTSGADAATPAAAAAIATAATAVQPAALYQRTVLNRNPSKRRQRTFPPKYFLILTHVWPKLFSAENLFKLSHFQENLDFVPCHA